MSCRHIALNFCCCFWLYLNGLFFPSLICWEDVTRKAKIRNKFCLSDFIQWMNHHSLCMELYVPDFNRFILLYRAKHTKQPHQNLPFGLYNNVDAGCCCCCWGDDEKELPVNILWICSCRCCCSWHINWYSSFASIAFIPNWLTSWFIFPDDCPNSMNKRSAYNGKNIRIWTSEKFFCRQMIMKGTFSNEISYQTLFSSIAIIHWNQCFFLSFRTKQKRMTGQERERVQAKHLFSANE